MAQTRTVEYKNAKVALVGESGVGKSGLALVLTGQPYAKTDSTHSRHIWTLQEEAVETGVRGQQQREVLLWDLAGQPGYRVHHQLHLDEVAVALVVFDARHETDPFAGVAYWAQALDEAAKGFPVVKLLVSARIDRGRPRVSKGEIKKMCTRYGMAGYYETSAQRGDGIAQLQQAIQQRLPWNAIAPVNAPEVFYDLKAFLKETKEKGEVLQTREALLTRYQSERDTEADMATLETCIGRLETTGLIRSLAFGNWTLLQPELLDQYGAWLAQEAGKPDNLLACVPEAQARRGSFTMDAERPLTRKPGEEGVLLVAMVEELVVRRIAWRQETAHGPMLVFPSELRTDMPEYPGDYAEVMEFRFRGAVSAIYATLAVCLLYSRAFKQHELYRNTAVFQDTGGKACGFKVDYPDLSDAAQGRLTIFFDADTDRAMRGLFLEYVEQQLEALAIQGSVQRERLYVCNDKSHKPYRIPPQVVTLALESGRRRIRCSICDTVFPLDDLQEPTARFDARIQEMNLQSQEEGERQQRLVTLDEREKSLQFDVFLSHNSKDARDTARLAKVLRDEGLLPWLDLEQILPGDQFAPALERILEEVPVGLVLVGPHSLGRWQKQEYYVLLQRFVEYRQQLGKKRLRLIPVLLPGAPEDSNLPPFLRGIHRVDFRDDGFNNSDEMRRLLKGILTPNEVY